jgi:hypothetical protein
VRWQCNIGTTCSEIQDLVPTKDSDFFGPSAWYPAVSDVQESAVEVEKPLDLGTCRESFRL